ncbi:MAG: AAA family ATPase, partial [Desulfovibrionaceae bacterium]
MTTSGPILYLFSGLPGAGKTALARRLAQQRRAAYLRIDTVEQGLRDLCGLDVQGEGYRLCYRIAADNLRLGLSVVADCCNPIELTRREWERTALAAGAEFRNIEVGCSDAGEHRRRVEARVSDVPGLAPPSWPEVQARRYDPWGAAEVIRIDTAGEAEEQSFARLTARLDAP